MIYGEKQNEIFELIERNIGLNIEYLEKTKVLGYIINLDNEYNVKKAVLSVCSKEQSEDKTKVHFVNYIKFLMNKKK